MIKQSYSTLELIEDLLREISKINKHFGSFSKTKLMEEVSVKIFDKGKNFLKHILSKIRNPSNPNYNPKYKFSIENLKKGEINLENLFKENAARIIELIKKYLLTNPDLKDYFHEQWKIHNPNLKARFFKQLDCKEKSYWYGLMCSDGSITSGQDPTKKRYQIAIELSIKDKSHLVNFCNIIGLDPRKIGERTKFINDKSFRMSYIIFTCKPMFQDLVNLGFREFKVGNRVFLNLGDDSISYAWLLGFYDGDGGEGKTKIYTTNLPLLLQIKESYDLKSKIIIREVEEVPEDALDESISRSKPMYELSLGPILLNTIMNSYRESLNRKRKFFSEKLYALESLKEKIGDVKNLKDLIEQYGKVKLSEMMGVSFKTLNNLCDEWNVDAKKITGVERLKKKVKNMGALIEMIEIHGKDKTARMLKSSLKTLKKLMEEWNIDAQYLTVRERLKQKIGNRERLQELIKKHSLTKLAEKFKVGRNTLKRLCDEWGVKI